MISDIQRTHSMEFTSPSNIPPRSILILGASELGTSIIAAVAAHPKLGNARLTILLRPASLDDAARLDAIRGLLPASRQAELSFISADLKTIPTADLTVLIRDGGYDTIISAAGARDGSGSLPKLADAVYAAGTVARYLPWQFAPDFDRTGAGPGGMFAEHVAVREKLRAYGTGGSKTVWTVVTTSMFLSLLFTEALGIVSGLEAARKKPAGEIVDGEVVVHALGSWDREFTVTEVGEIGKAVAEIVASGHDLPLNDRGGRIVYLSSETLNFGKLANIVEQVIGKKVRREIRSLDSLKEEVHEDPGDRAAKFRVVYAEGEGVSWPKATSFNASEAVNVEDWLRAHFTL